MRRAAAAAARLARLHARIANLRADALHKATSMLAGRYETVVVEDLNVAGMTRNRRLARALGSGVRAARRTLAYRPPGTAGRSSPPTSRYPSTKTCSGCRQAKAKLALAERTYRCNGCGLVITGT